MIWLICQENKSPKMKILLNTFYHDLNELEEHYFDKNFE